MAAWRIREVFDDLGFSRAERRVILAEAKAEVRLKNGRTMTSAPAYWLRSAILAGLATLFCLQAASRFVHLHPPYAFLIWLTISAVAAWLLIRHTARSNEEALQPEVLRLLRECGHWVCQSCGHVLQERQPGEYFCPECAMYMSAPAP